MKLIALSTEQAPHISVPLRFFAVAPLFLLLAALMLATGEGNPFAHPICIHPRCLPRRMASRWDLSA